MNIPIKAKIYAATDSQTSIKCFANVSIGGAFYINSYVISNTIGEPDKLYAFPPAYRNKRGNYMPYIEFPGGKDNEVSGAIYKACISAYKKYLDTKRLHEYGETFCADLNKLSESGWEKENRYASKAKSYEKYGYAGEDEELDLSDIPF